MTEAGDGPVAAYKRLLRAYLDRRPSGTRQRLAAALGTHKSFVSQITNPAYRVPLPAQHVARIMAICRFSPEEREAFLAAWRAAHPEQPSGPESSGPESSGPESSGPESSDDGVVRIEVPEFGDPARRREVAELIRDMAERIIALAERATTTPERGREETT